MITMRTMAVALLPAITFPLITAVPARGDDRIEKIRALYKDAQELACENEDECGGTVHRLRMATTLPAIGLQVTDVRFYHTSWQAAPERDPYLMDSALKMVSVTYNIAGSVTFLIEYLYDEKGEPVFYYRQEKSGYGEKPVVSEKRYYFQNGRLIRVVRGDSGDESAPRTFTQLSSFQAKDVADAKLAHGKALRYRGLFKTILQAEQWK